MNLRGILLATATAAMLPTAALAASEGFYVGAQGGFNWLNESEFKGLSTNLNADYDLGWAAGITAGYKTGFGVRTELEATYRSNDVDKVTDPRPGAHWTGDTSSWALMANVLYDFNTGWPVTPYVGVGIGAARVKIDAHDNFSPSVRIDDDSTRFAYQGIIGASYDINNNLALTLDYRYFATLDPKFDADFGGASFKTKGEYSSHTVMAGLRYSFGAPAPAPMPVAAPVPPAPAPAAQEQGDFLVFFDWNQSNITPASDRIISDAAAAAGRQRTVGIQVTGHTDTSGSPAYNQRLSVRRAEAVRQALIAKGVAANQITVQGQGENQLLVPTGPNVREPSNRRAQIVIRVS